MQVYLGAGVLIQVLPIHFHTKIPYSSVVHFIGELCICVFKTVHQSASVGCLLSRSCSIQLFSTRVYFYSAILQTDVIQRRCLPQACFLHVLVDVFSIGLPPCRCVPRRSFFIRDSPPGSAPDRSASYLGVSMPRVCGPTDLPAMRAGASSSTCALLLLFTSPNYRIGFPLQVRSRRGRTSRLAPPPLCSGAQAGSALPSQVSD